MSRDAVVAAATSQAGRTDPEPYWRDVLGNAAPPYPPSWCGAFALWCLRRGAACDWSWQIGRGFLWRLPTTTDPQPGDIGYVDRFQHHAVVIAADGSTIRSCDGNAMGGTVAERVRPRSDYAAFYSIVPLLVGEVAVAREPRIESVAPVRGLDVREIQEALRSGGYDPGPVDGVAGRRTAQAALRWAWERIARSK